MDHHIPRFHRIFTHRLAAGLARRPDTKVTAFTWGPISILWDPTFKRVSNRWKREQG